MAANSIIFPLGNPRAECSSQWCAQMTSRQLIAITFYTPPTLTAVATNSLSTAVEQVNLYGNLWSSTFHSIFVEYRVKISSVLLCPILLLITRAVNFGNSVSMFLFRRWTGQTNECMRFKCDWQGKCNDVTSNELLHDEEEKKYVTLTTFVKRTILLVWNELNCSDVNECLELIAGGSASPSLIFQWNLIQPRSMFACQFVEMKSKLIYGFQWSVAQCTNCYTASPSNIETSHTGDSIQQQVRDLHYVFSGTNRGLFIIKHRQREQGEWRIQAWWSIRNRTSSSPFKWGVHGNCIYNLCSSTRWPIRMVRSVHRQICSPYTRLCLESIIICVESRFCWQPRLLLPYSIVSPTSRAAAGLPVAIDHHISLTIRSWFTVAFRWLTRVFWGEAQEYNVHIHCSVVQGGGGNEWWWRWSSDKSWMKRNKFNDIPPRDFRQENHDEEWRHVLENNKFALGAIPA